MSTPAVPLEEMKARLAEELSRFPEVAAAWLFGSVARGEATAESDVDVGLVLRQRGLKARDCHRWLRTVAARLEHAAGGRTIDLVLLEAQGPVFRHRVLVEGQLIYEANRDRRVDFESTATVEYFDFLPTYELAAKQALAGFRRWLEARR